MAAVPAELLQMLVSSLAVAALLRSRGDSISNLMRDDLFLCEAACSTRAVSHCILPASMAPLSVQHLWAEEPLSFKAANGHFAPCMRQQLIAYAFFSPVYALK